MENVSYNSDLCTSSKHELKFSEVDSIATCRVRHFSFGSGHSNGLLTVLANERTQIRSDPVPGLSVDTLGGYRVGNAVTRSESDTARAG